jgi:ATP-binding cassette subfamily C protein CydCD
MSGIRDMNRGPLYLLGLLGALKALGLVLIANAIATGIVAVIHGEAGWRGAVAIGLVGAILRAVVTWATEVVSHRAMIGEKQRLRAELAERLVDDASGDNVGAMTTLATRGLDELDKYYTVFLPALVAAATVPLVVGARILFADPLSALVVALTVPLIPVFMTLIGMHTNERVAAATDAMARLSDHLVELARGLPVLIGLGRVHDQTEALRRISEDHRRASVRTLRTAFLSSLALELIATISVAVVAVVVGVRLVSGTMSLEVGLLALVLAPECFIPFRAIGSAFHASQDGVEALRRVRDVVDAPGRAWSIRSTRGTRVRVDGLSVTYADRVEPAIAHLSFDTQPNGITVLHGASGAGKSTVLAAMAGVVPPSARVTGGIVSPGPAHVAYLPQHPHTVADTAIAELKVYDAAISDDDARRLLELLGLGELAGTDPALFSPGELRRLAFARVLARVNAGATLVLLDEPTAHLDDASARAVRTMIARVTASATVIVASHDPTVQAMADRTVHVDASHAHPRPRPAATEVDQTDGSTAVSAGGHTVFADLDTHPYRELGRFLRPVLLRVTAAVILGTLAVAFAVALTAVSGWLIVRASEHPPILYLLVAIVGVRFFGIGRGVLRWCERVVSHDAIFAALTTLRVRLWRGLAARGPANKSLLAAGSTLDRLVSDADQVRDLVLRVVMPPLVAAAITVSATAVLAAIYPPALWPMVSLIAIALVIAPLAAVWANHHAAATASAARSASVRTFAGMLAASAELKANDADVVVRQRVSMLDAQLARADRRSAFSLGIGTALVVLACSSVAILMLPVAAADVAGGALPAGLMAVLVLTPLGLIDPLLDAVDAAQQWPTLKRVLGRVGDVTAAGDSANTDSDDTTEAPSVESLTIQDLAYTYPNATVSAFSGLDAAVTRGQWLTVTGPSGSGKSTLLGVLLRYLAPSRGRYFLNDVDAETLSGDSVRSRVAWCPQEGHLFDSSLRSNLLIARSRDDAPDDAELISALERVGLDDFVAALPHGLDTRIGSAGAFMSGGQRQRVAVARTLLARCDVLLIDEPTAHLDDQAATSLLTDLRGAAAGTITVLVTHHVTTIDADDQRLRLGEITTESRAGVVLGA